MLVMLADPNAGTVHFDATCILCNTTNFNVCCFFNDNCMSLIYFQGLGLIANDSATTTTETGAFMNYKPAAFCLDVLHLSDGCALSSSGVSTSPNLSACYPSPNLKWPFCTMMGGFFKTLNFSLKLGPFVPAVFDSRAFSLSVYFLDLPVAIILKQIMF